MKNCKPIILLKDSEFCNLLVIKSELFNNKGKHCLIEKPITSSYEEAKLLCAEAKSRNLKIQVGHVERFNPAIAAVQDYLNNPLFIEAHRLSQFKPRAIDVSVVHDLMIHDIDVILSVVKSKVKNRLLP